MDAQSANIFNIIFIFISKLFIFIKVQYDYKFDHEIARNHIE